MLGAARGFARYRNRSVVVSSDGMVVRGVIESADSRVVVVRDCQSIDTRMGAVPVDGMVVFPTGKIHYVQVK